MAMGRHATDQCELATVCLPGIGTYFLSFLCRSLPLLLLCGCLNQHVMPRRLRNPGCRPSGSTFMPVRLQTLDFPTPQDLHGTWASLHHYAVHTCAHPATCPLPADCLPWCTAHEGFHASPIVLDGLLQMQTLQS